jgi:hypothetical protein
MLGRRCEFCQHYVLDQLHGLTDDVLKHTVATHIWVQCLQSQIALFYEEHYAGFDSISHFSQVQTSRAASVNVHEGIVLFI